VVSSCSMTVSARVLALYTPLYAAIRRYNVVHYACLFLSDLLDCIELLTEIQKDPTTWGRGGLKSSELPAHVPFLVYVLRQI
jgi:hypothetical protein